MWKSPSWSPLRDKSPTIHGHEHWPRRNSPQRRPFSVISGERTAVRPGCRAPGAQCRHIMGRAIAPNQSGTGDKWGGPTDDGAPV